MATQKFTKDEMDKLNKLQASYQEVTANFGRLHVQEVILNQQIDAMESEKDRLEKSYVDLQTKEQELVKSLNEKYGAGTLDIVSGEFTPSPKADSQGPSATPNS